MLTVTILFFFFFFHSWCHPNNLINQNSLCCNSIFSLSLLFHSYIDISAANRNFNPVYIAKTSNALYMWKQHSMVNDRFSCITTYSLYIHTASITISTNYKSHHVFHPLNFDMNANGYDTGILFYEQTTAPLIRKFTANQSNSFSYWWGHQKVPQVK